MTVTSRHGGARPKTRGDDKRGGSGRGQGRKQTRLVLSIGDTIHMRGNDWTIRAFLANGHVSLERVDKDGSNLQTGFGYTKKSRG